MEKVNVFLDNLFQENAKNEEREMNGKQYNYKLFSGLFMDNLVASGKCKVVSRRYCKNLDCDILSCVDMETNKTFSCNQFAIELKEVA